MMVCTHDEARRLARANHLDGVCKADGKGLFAKNVLTGRGGGNDLLVVRVVTCRDVYRIDCWIGQEFRETRGLVWNVKFGRKRMSSLSRSAYDRNEFGIRLSRNCLGDPRTSDAGRT